MKRILMLAVIVTASTAAYSQNKNFDQDGKVPVISEHAFLTINPMDSESLASTEQFAGAVLGAVLPAVVDYTVTAGKQHLKNRLASFTGEYVCSSSGQSFYENKTSVRLPKLIISRRVILEGNNLSEAINIVLSPELSENKTAFRYVLKDSFTLKYAKARTKGIYDYIDLAIKVQFKSITLAKEKYEISDLRTTIISVPMVKVGELYTPTTPLVSGWIPLLPKSSVMEKLGDQTPPDNTVKTVSTETSKTGSPITSQTVTETVTSTDFNKVTEVDITSNAGLYEVEVTVTETNPYKIKAENKQQLIENTGDKGVAVLKAIIEQSFKKKDPEESAEESQ